VDDPTLLTARMPYSATLSCRLQSLNANPAVVGDLADQVATKTVSGSRLDPFFTGLLRSPTQREQCSSCWCGDLEAGGRTSAAGRRFRVRLSLDAVLPAPNDSSQKIWAPTVFSPIDAQTGSGFSPAETQAASAFSPRGARTPSGFSPAETQAARIFSPAEVEAERSLSQVPSPQRRNASSSPFAHDGQKTVGAYIFWLEFFGSRKTASRLSRARALPPAADVRPPASKSPHPLYERRSR